MHAELQVQEPRKRAGLAETLFLALAARVKYGRLAITLPNGDQLEFAGCAPGPQASLRFRHPRAFRRLLLGGTLAFAEAFMDGDCDSPDLAALVELVIKNEKALMVALDGHRWTRILQRFGHLLRPNSRRGARRNIARHYDLGNKFYALWLDPSMTYSSAVYETPQDSLHAAQENKYRRVAELAGIGPDDHVLEIGCGWGGFCGWAVREIGCRLTALTISPAQHAHAARRLQDEGIAEKVDLRLQDYRDVRGRFDRIVSIEMLEAVGEKYWPRFFGTLRDRLAPAGRAVLQVIVIGDEYFDAYRKDVDFIQRYIFPGGLLPSPGRLGAEARRAGLDWLDRRSFGHDYARTLAAWGRTFEGARQQVFDLGFDERFVRMWRYYLAYCEAGFKTGRIDVLHAAFARS